MNVVLSRLSISILWRFLLTKPWGSELEATDEPENIIEHIAAQFGPEWDAESDEKDIEQPKIKISETYTALQLLRLFEKEQKDEDSSVLSFLNKYEQRIQDRRMRESQQRPITAFFSANK